MDIKFRVAGQKLMMLTKYNKFVSDAKDFMYLVFDLPREWAGYAVTAEFVQDGKIISKSLNQGNGVYLPNELSAGICILALRGTNSGSIVTTDSIALYIDKYVGSDRSGGSGDSYITVELAEPTISVDQNGVVTATVNQEEGYVVKSSKQSSLRLPTHSGGSIVPEKNNKVAVQSGMYTTGDVIISGDKNLDPSNIRKGATIFNVSGEYEGSVGVDLPTISNPAYDEHVFADKEYINADGLKRSGSFTIDNELTEQDALIMQISNALRNKAVATDPGTLPPLENPASSSDMATGKELYDQDGNVVTGTLPDLTDGAAIFANSTHEVGGTKGGNTFNVAAVYSNTAVQGVIVRPSARLGVRSVPTSLMGDATAAQVAKGATFTSAAGYLAVGTHECEGGVTLPELSNPATASDLAYDKQLIGADGEIITGTLGEVTEGAKIFGAGEVTLLSSAGATEFAVGAVYSPNNIGNNTVGCILRPGAVMAPRYVPTSLFGNATQAQVAKGATFTSASGLLMEGTHVCEGGVELPDLGDTAAQPTDMVLGKVLYDDEGNPVTGTLDQTEVGTYAWAADDIIMIGDSGETTFNISGVYGKNYIGSDTFHGFVCRPGARFALRNVETSLFGNALPEQVAKGATFTSAAGLKVEGTMEAASGGGLVVKKGNTSSPTIETGLSSIDYFVLMTTGFTKAGLMQMLYRKPNNAISYILCTSYSYSTMKTELNHANMTSSTLFTIDGGTVTWNGTGTSAFMSGESYMWLAFGA